MPGAKNMRNKLQEQKLRMAEINRKQAALHRLEAQKIRGREAETSHLMHELGPGSKTFVAPH